MAIYAVGLAERAKRKMVCLCSPDLNLCPLSKFRTESEKVPKSSRE